MTTQFEEPDLPPITTMAQPPLPDSGSTMGDIAKYAPLALMPQVGAAKMVAEAVGQGISHPEQVGAMFTAASKQAQYDDSLGMGKYYSNVDATENRINDIHKATGEFLENPYRDGYQQEALEAYAKEPKIDNPGLQPAFGAIKTEDLPRIHQLQMQLFQQKLGELKDKYPDKADVIGADKPIAEDAKELANQSETNAAASMQGTSGLLPIATSFAGGMYGSFRNPMQVAALFAGAPELGALQGAGVAGKIAAEGLRQGFVNAGISAIGQPGVQAWRAERGRETGVVPALEDVGRSFLFGLIPGAILGGVHAATHVPPPEVVNRALGGDVDAAQQVAAALPKEAVPELHAAVEAHEMNQAVLQDIPKGVSIRQVQGEQMMATIRQALRHAEDPTEPLPELPASQVSDAPAREAVADARTPMQAADALRQEDAAISLAQTTPEADIGIPRSRVESALASDDPNMRRLGQVASLGDEAYRMVKSGEIDPTVATEVGARVHDPNEQISVMREVAAGRPMNAAQAAQLTTEVMERRALPQAEHTLLGADGPVERELPTPATDLAEPSARDKQVADFEQRLQDTYGSRMEAPPPPVGFLDTVPSTTRTDAADMIPMNRADILAREPRAGFLASLIAGCPEG